MMTLLLVLCGIWMYLSVVRGPVEKYQAVHVGFLRACLLLGNTGFSHPPINRTLNEEAENYVAQVYGLQGMPGSLRRTLTGLIFGALVSGYTTAFLFADGCSVFVVDMGTQIFVAFSIFALFLWVTILIKMHKKGIPLRGEERALKEICRLRAGPHGRKIDALLYGKKVPTMWWWPYPQHLMRALSNRGKILAFSFPVAWVFVHSTAAKAFLKTYPLTLNEYAIMVSFAVAISWVALIFALTIGGRWQGSRRVVCDTFPLYILMQDIVDLLI